MLERLKQRLEEGQWPVAPNLAPGLTDSQIDDVVAPLEISLPEEARTWWRWRNGVPRGAGGRDLGPGRPVLPLEEAVADCQRIRAMMARYTTARDAALPLAWRSSWLPLTAGVPLILLDTVGQADEPVPIWSYHFHDAPPTVSVLPSLGELVCIWIDAMDCGGWSYDAETCMLDYRPELVDQRAAKAGLA